MVTMKDKYGFKSQVPVHNFFVVEVFPEGDNLLVWVSPLINFESLMRCGTRMHPCSVGTMDACLSNIDAFSEILEPVNQMQNSYL